MNSFERIGYHEATVTAFGLTDEGLELALEDVAVNGKKARAVLRVAPVICVSADDEILPKVQMETSDGEVLSLETSENSLSLIVEWNDFIRHSSFTKCYRVLGGHVSILVQEDPE